MGVVFFDEASRFLCGSVRQDLVKLDGNMEVGHGGRGGVILISETPFLQTPFQFEANVNLLGAFGAAGGLTPSLGHAERDQGWHFQQFCDRQ